MKTHSNAYIDFINQIDATGYQKAQGYDPDLFNKIDDRERAEVEQIVVEQFKKGDRATAMFLPQIKSIDGSALLKEELEKWNPPHIVNAELAHILYKATNDDSYENLLIEDLKITTKSYRSTVVGYLLDCKPSEKLENIFKEIYTIDTATIARFNAAIGFAYCKDLLKSTINLDYDNPIFDLVRALSSGVEEERLKAEEKIAELGGNEA
ncbi:MAG TPA: hypothetical protein VIO64_19065 [Pseudobacteroides sp.]|uniref:hypothetical protein n=1 Tax=Pseudobacteroides sp. TaxID=1968840 RepID=UPI002F93EBD6